MQLEGILTRAHDVPQVRRKVPAPFTRQRIDLDGGRRVKRAWKDTSVLNVKKGDTIANFGTVDHVVEFLKAPELSDGVVDFAVSSDVTVTWRIRLYNVMGDYQDFPGEQRVFAFVAEAS